MTSKLRNDLLRVFHKRAPNSIREELIIKELSNYNDKDVIGALDSLVAEHIAQKDISRIGRTGQVTTAYKLESYENIPIRSSYTIGDTITPRMLDTDKARAEDVNVVIEALSDYANSLESRFREMIDKEMRAYYANIIILFGIFIGLFSLILGTAGKMVIDPSWSWWHIFAINMAQVLPLSCVLIVFMLLLKCLFK